MANGATTNALARLLRPLSRELTVDLAEALVRLQADSETQARYNELAAKHSSGESTSGEEAELEAIVRANTLLGILKAEAHAFLTSAGRP